MNDFMKKIQVLARIEMTIFRINMQTASRQVLLYAVGLVLILLAVAMLNVGVYMALSEIYGRAVGALIVAGINGLLAVILMVVAGRTKPGPEAAMAKEIRDLAVSEINMDVERVYQNLNEVKSDVQRIRSGFGSLLSGGGAMFSLSSLVPLIDLLIGSLRKSKKS